MTHSGIFSVHQQNQLPSHRCQRNLSPKVTLLPFDHRHSIFVILIVATPPVETLPFYSAWRVTGIRIDQIPITAMQISDFCLMLGPEYSKLGPVQKQECALYIK